MISWLNCVMAASIVCCVVRTGHADPGETRAQIIARYGKPDSSDERPKAQIDAEGQLQSEARTILRFSGKEAPGMVVLNRDGKSVEEIYGWATNIGQERVMAILNRISRGQPWSTTRVNGLEDALHWQYTQPELKLHATYKRNDAAHDATYYGLSVSQ